MGNKWRKANLNNPTRPDELLCGTCVEFHPDEHFLERAANTARRGRGMTCARCLVRRRARYVGATAANDIDLSDEWPARPPEMQGRAVSIFTGRTPCPPPPIKPEPEPAYWSRIRMSDQ